LINKAVILAGGKGSRLGSIVSDTPKPMLSVAGNPFIFYIIRQLASYSIKEINILTGYKSQVFDDYIKNFKFQNIKINLIKEEFPLGTGGALKSFFKNNHDNERFLVMNGDAFIDVDLTSVVTDFKSDYDIDIIGTEVPFEENRYGEVICEENKVIEFKEKDSQSQSNLINSGIYIFNNTFSIRFFKEDIFSLEELFFPKQVKDSKLGIKVLQNKFFLDIGLPDTFELSQHTINRPKRCLFLDRDNTINFDKGYTHKTSDLRFTPQIINLMVLAKRLNFLIIVVSNQSGIGRGFYDENDLWNFHYNMQSALIESNVNIDALYFCPHLPKPKDSCGCRKPKTGLMNDIINDWNIDLDSSIFIGDSEIDKQFAEKSNISKFNYIQEIQDYKDVKNIFNFLI
jgi:D-glycero-D-manno-heptose 1,7-bisphosphate phosphatase